MPYIQVGVIALRTPDGEFLPAQPIYRDIPEPPPGKDYIPADELADIFAEKFKKHRETTKKRGKDL